MSKSPTPTSSIGDTLRQQRVNVLDKSLREMAGILDITPAHLSDIERGQRKPSEELLQRICKHYRIREGTLRSAWEKLDEVVQRIGTQNADFSEKVPALLSAAQKFSSSQLDSLIEHAKQMARDTGGQKR